MSGQVWLTLHTMPNGSAISVAVDRREAWALDRKGFSKLYRGCCPGASRKEANAWADEQVRLRDLAAVSAAVPEEQQ